MEIVASPPKLRILLRLNRMATFQNIIDYSDRLIMKFEKDISEQTYQTLDSLIATNKTNWRKKGNMYVFNAMWGNGRPAPEGEDEKEDRTFSLTFEKGNKKATINNGTW